MATQIEKMTVEDLTQNLVQGAVDINALNLAKATQREAFKKAIEKRPNLLKNITSYNADHFLTFAIKENPEYFVYLDVKQYTDALAQKYLTKRLEKKQTALPSASAEGCTFSVQQSLDNKLLFSFSYVTPKNDVLSYFDTELQVPVSVKSSIQVQMKLTDAVRLIHKLDVSVTQIGEKKMETTFMDAIVARYKAFLNEYIAKNKVGYYTLCASAQGLEKSFQKELDDVFGVYGIDVLQFQIKQLAIPKDIKNKIEDLAFALRQQRANMDAELEFARKSLENYEKKLVIEEKYPNAQHSLTEYEKDLALKRYLIKKGRLEEEAINHSIDLKQENVGTDKAVDKQKDIIPEIPLKKNRFKRTFITFSIICTFVSLLLFTSGTGAGLIALGITVGLFGTIAAFNHEKFKDEQIEIINGGDDYVNAGSNN